MNRNYYYDIYDTNIYDILKTYGRINEEDDEKYSKEQVQKILNYQSNIFLNQAQKIYENNIIPLKTENKELEGIIEKNNQLYMEYMDSVNRENDLVINNIVKEMENNNKKYNELMKQITYLPPNIEKEFNSLLTKSITNYNINPNESKNIQLNISNKNLYNFISNNPKYSTNFKYIIHNKGYNNIFYEKIFNMIYNPNSTNDNDNDIYYVKFRDENGKWKTEKRTKK